MAHHLALGAVALQHLYLLLDFLCFLKLHFLCPAHHFLLQIVEHLARVALQNLPCLADVFTVFFLTDVGHAGGVAPLQMVFQAGLVLLLPHFLGQDGGVAGARFVEPVDHVEHGVHGRDVGVGTEVGAPLLVDVAGAEYAWKRLVGDADAGVGLAVFQQHVVAGIVFLDEAVLQQQGVFLGLHHRVGDVAYLAHEHLGLVAVHFLVKIGAHSALQVLRLSHVDDSALVVVVLVAAGLLGHVAHDVLELGLQLFLFLAVHRMVLSDSKAVFHVKHGPAVVVCRCLNLDE